MPNFGIIRPHNRKIQYLARLLDIIVITLTLWAILDISGNQWDLNHQWWVLVSVISFSIFVEFNGLYREKRGLLIRKEIKIILVGWFLAVMVIISINQFRLIIYPVDQQNFWSWVSVVPIEILSWHILVENILRTIRRRGINHRRVAIIGVTHVGIELRRLFREEEWMGLSFVGYYDDRKHNRLEPIEVDIKGNFKELIEKTKQGEVDIIYITLALKAEDRIKQVVEELADTTVSAYYVPDFFGFELLRSEWSSIGNIPIMSIYETPFHGVNSVLKRLFDIVFSSFTLLIIALPMLMIALSVKLSSPGPALFKQRRFGIKGEEVVIWKFRSMTVSEDGDKVTQATQNDPRVTKLGNFLRRTSLDELPQFINVLYGDMSVVGPRPHAVAHNQLYRKQVQGYMLRHKVKPGITGLAQIKGFRGETDTLDKMEGRIKYDLEYISKWSLWLDIKIVLLTIFKGFISKQAY